MQAVAEPATAAEVATARATDQRATRLLLDALVGLGILELADERYAIVPTLRAALQEGPQSILPMLRHRSDLWKAWSKLSEVVRTGVPALDPYERDERPDGQVQRFIAAMDVAARKSAPGTVAALDQTGATNLLDIGGGPGTYAAAFCKAWPQLRVVILDLPRVCEIARQNLAGTEHQDRVGFVAGEARTVEDEPVLAQSGGAGFDLVFGSNLIHSMDPDQVQVLLGRMASWTKPGGRVVVKDFFLDDPRTAPASAALFAINMLVNTPGGRSYTWSEVERWLAAAAPGSAERIELPGGTSGMVVHRLASRGAS